MYEKLRNSSRTIVAAILLGMISLAHAQAVEQFNLPAQSLADSLRAVGTQTNINVLFDPPLVASYQAPALSAKVSVDEALTRLLASTPFRHKFVDERTVVLSAVKAAGGEGKESKAKTGMLEDGSATSMRVAQESDATRKSGNSAAGTTKDAANAVGSEASDNSLVQEIVVTAQKRKERLQDVPISISVLGGEALDKASFVSVADALKTVPGVALTQLDSGVKLNIRGVGAAFGSSPIGYYLDSIPFGLVKTDLTPNQNAYDLERVEVLRGPQGTLYGVNAENGLVRVLTKDANPNAFEFKARASASTTEDGGDSNRIDTAINVPLIEGKLAARAVIGYENSAGWIDGPRGRDLNDGRLRNYRLKVNAKPTDELSIGLSWWRTADDYGGFNKSLSTDSGRTLSDIPESLVNEFDAYGLKVEYAFSGFSVTSMSSYLDYLNQSVYDLTADIYAGFVLPYPVLQTAQHAKLKSEEIVVNSTSDGPWHWTAGAIYRDAYDTVDQPSLGGGIPFSYKYASESYAFFGEAGRRFGGDKFEWTLGMRSFHDRVSVTELINQSPGTPAFNQTASYDSTTPRAVLKWYPHRDAMLYASYSQGFRSGFPQDPGVGKAFPDFPTLKPDKLKNYEIGAKGSLSEGRVVFDTAVYYIDWKDVQQPLLVPFQQTFVYAPVNGQSASGMGIDFGIGLRPLRGLQLDAAVSWNDLTQEEDVYTGGNLLFLKGDRLAFSPEYSASVSAQYRFPMSNSGFEGEFAAATHYLSEETTFEIDFFGTNRVKLSGDSSWISRSSFTVLSPRNWTATLFVDNLSNWDGRVTRSQIPNWTERVRPRTIGVQFDYSFGR